MAEERDSHLGELIDRRVQVYGDPTVTFARIAQMWSGLIGHEILPYQVPLMMVAIKMVRADVMPDYSDNSDDIDGYMDIFRKLVPDMIHARTVDDFIKQKWPEPPDPNQPPLFVHDHTRPLTTISKIMAGLNPT